MKRQSNNFIQVLTDSHQHYLLENMNEVNTQRAPYQTLGMQTADLLPLIHMALKFAVSGLAGVSAKSV